MSKNRTVIFRCDASHKIGSGHVYRNVALAKSLKTLGYTPTFIQRAHPGNLGHFVEAQGFRSILLPVDNEYIVGANLGPDDYEGWLGTSWSKDAEETIDTIYKSKEERPEWVVIDHYGLDHRWERKLRVHTDRIMVIDDLANRKHEADVLLDQNYFINASERYADLIPEHTQTLLGPRYAILRPEYSELHIKQQEKCYKDEENLRMLVNFGGVDRSNQTLRVLHILCKEPSLAKKLQVTAVAGANNKCLPEVHKLKDFLPSLQVHSHVDDFASLMVKQDLAIGAPGTTTWERLCLRLPTIAIAIADNQEEPAQNLARSGFITYLGRDEKISDQEILESILTLSSNRKLLHHFANKGGQLVDGRGLERVCGALETVSLKI